MNLTTYHPFLSAQAKEHYLKQYDLWGMKWPIVSECKTINTSYGQTFVRISGLADAPPLVLMPGANTTSLMWISNIETLSSNYQTYAVDYDFGHSIFTRAIESTTDLTTWFNELFDNLGLKNKINLLGTSLGGLQVVQYASHFPERLNKLVLLAPGATVLPFRSQFYLRAFLSIVPPFSKNVMRWLFRDFIHKDETSRNSAEEMFDQILLIGKSFTISPKRYLKMTVLNDEELQNIAVPVLYLVGENEKIYSAHKAIKRLNKVAPHIQTEIIPNAGHDLTVVQADLVNRKVLEFLKQS